MFAVLIFAASFGQTFNGVKIGGTMAQMKFKLEQKGFKTDEIKSNIIWMLGKMATKDVMIGICGTPKTKTAWKVIVIFTDEKVGWYSMKSEYYDTKEILTKKYGSPQECFEYFKSPYYEGDGYEKQAITNEQATFSCYYEGVEENKMNLSISISKSFNVLIAYENIELSKLFNSEKELIEQNSF